jgi:hypothetical protein
VKRLQSRPCFVESLSGRRFVFLRDGLERFLKRLHTALPIAEERDTRRLERVDVGRGVEGGGAFSFDGFCFGQILIEVHIGELTDVV